MNDSYLEVVICSDKKDVVQLTECNSVGSKQVLPMVINPIKYPLWHCVVSSINNFHSDLLWLHF